MSLNESINDPVLVAALKRGDRRAFSRLVKLYQDKIYSLCFRILGSSSEAQEVAQEVFVTVFRRVGSFRGASKLSTWIYRIATNHALNRSKYLRRRKVPQTTSLDDPTRQAHQPEALTQVPRPDEWLAARQLEAYVHDQLASLDDDQRTALVLRDMEGLSYQEICEITGEHMGTIKSRLHRARMHMKRALDAWMRGDVVTEDKR